MPVDKEQIRKIIVTGRGTYSVSIPKRMIKRLGWRKGQKVVFEKKGKKLMDKLSAAMDKGLVRACHDCSEGGIGVAAAEMAFAGGLGMTINLGKVPLGESIERDDFILFSESNTRFIAEVAPANRENFEKMMSGVDFAEIGLVTDDEKFLLHDNLDRKQVAKYSYDNLLDIIAVGFDPKKTHIFIDTEYGKTLYNIAVDISKRVTLLLLLVLLVWDTSSQFQLQTRFIATIFFISVNDTFII